MRWINLLLVLGTFLVYLSPYIPPHVFFPLVFPGLLFPWLILANALFFVFWLIVRDRYFLFSLGVIVLGFAEVSSIIGRPWGQLNHNDSNELTLVTLLTVPISFTALSFFLKNPIPIIIEYIFINTKWSRHISFT